MNCRFKKVISFSISFSQRRHLSLNDILEDSSRKYKTIVTEVFLSFFVNNFTFSTIFLYFSLLFYDQCSKNGFIINNLIVKKPVILLPNSFFIWNTNSFEEIDVKSLSIFTYLYPTPEIIIVGCGSGPKERLDVNVREYFQMRGIVIDQMDSVNAVQTFNVLISEGRNVGAAVLPLPSK